MLPQFDCLSGDSQFESTKFAGREPSVGSRFEDFSVRMQVLEPGSIIPSDLDGGTISIG